MNKIIITLLIISLVFTYFFFGDEKFVPSQNDGEYVVILHGIARSSSHMGELAKYLDGNGYDVVNIDYPSTDYKLKDLLDIIHNDILTKLVEDKPVNFVGYSMGGVLVRAIINKYPPNKLHRVVQLASPNNGSEVSDFLEYNLLYKKIYGLAGQELTTNNESTQKLMGKVDYEMGVIAGNSTIDPISSVIIPNDDDGKVSIKSTKVEGMKDHIVLSATHTFFPTNKDVHKQVLYFLQKGKFNHPVIEKDK